ncbi:MAG: hypothetical protein C4519_05880 [Desulfobacteraceae bacterium]|nr:MAG: hypothetical protein C4519_05880 [Desulfobacteraceae bacterium]
MLSLPSKPWKKASLASIGEDLYHLTFLDPLPSAREFEEIVKTLEDLISATEEVVFKDSDHLQLQLRIRDLKIFKRRLIFLNISIVKEAG